MTICSTLAVLVVDDSGTMVRIIRSLLHKIGVNDVDDACDGSDALSKMENKRYGLVISDWNMQPMSGFDFLKGIRSHPRLRETPFIMVTAEAKPENVVAARKAGVNNYIIKPFSADTLKDKIDSALMSSYV